MNIKKVFCERKMGMNIEEANKILDEANKDFVIGKVYVVYNDFFLTDPDREDPDWFSIENNDEPVLITTNKLDAEEMVKQLNESEPIERSYIYTNTAHYDERPLYGEPHKSLSEKLYIIYDFYNDNMWNGFDVYANLDMALERSRELREAHNTLDMYEDIGVPYKRYDVIEYEDGKIGRGLNISSKLQRFSEELGYSFRGEDFNKILEELEKEDFGLDYLSGSIYADIDKVKALFAGYQEKKLGVTNKEKAFEDVKEIHDVGEVSKAISDRSREDINEVVAECAKNMEEKQAEGNKIPDGTTQAD